MSDAPVPTDPTGRRYAATAIVLHWAIAGLIVANIVLAWQFDDLKGMAQFRLIQWHKSLGVTVLLLTLLRFAWRLFNRPPPFPPEMPRWERIAAAATHWGFYAFMVLMPVTGWLMVSASPTNIPTLLYRTVPWPHLGFIHHLPMIERKPLEHQFKAWHETIADIGYVLIVLHVAAALRHQLFKRDLVLWRMAPLPLLKPRPARTEETR